MLSPSVDSVKVPSAIRANSTTDSDASSDNSDNDEWTESPKQRRSSRGASRTDGRNNRGRSPIPLRWITSSLLGAVAAMGMVAFSLWFPFALPTDAAEKTYDWAFYHYDKELSLFDNNIWTYGTDYALGVIMACLALMILRQSQAAVSDRMCRRSASLLLCYCVSVLSGGTAHQHYHTVEERNLLSFRLLWTVCVGTVCFASTFMGMSASQAVCQFQQKPGCSPWLKRMPILPDSFWLSFGAGVTTVCAWGGMSFQRPACDIFIAGITQSVSSFYIMAFFYTVQHKKVPAWARTVGFLAFILNAPLLPMYPLLVQFTNWSLASINTLLHSWLCLSWSMQGISMYQTILALNFDAQETRRNKHR